MTIFSLILVFKNIVNKILFIITFKIKKSTYSYRNLCYKKKNIKLIIKHLNNNKILLFLKYI